jgi:hypothetical protein
VRNEYHFTPVTTTDTSQLTPVTVTDAWETSFGGASFRNSYNLLSSMASK